MEKSVERQIEEALAGFSGWGTIDDLLSFVVEAIDIPEDFRRTSVQTRLASLIRRKIKARVGADGLSEFESVERETKDGDTKRVYKQLSLFDKQDFQMTIGYYSNRASYSARKANSLTNLCNSKLKTRRPLPFPEFGTLADDVAKAQ